MANFTQIGGCSSAIRLASRLEGPAYVPAIVSQPRKSDHGTHQLTNNNPNRRDLIMAHNK
ncbi:hypothetical protein [Lactiplantibacillus pentosus]|uniref:hypothetical protein n=1 Tax=Lactiplantibacillus pentosus TaxID=1589 RepID=UPI0021A342CF|nr:hypothetical protein [Lactiplantibacillus pentosus]